MCLCRVSGDAEQKADVEIIQSLAQELQDLNFPSTENGGRITLGDLGIQLGTDHSTT